MAEDPIKFVAKRLAPLEKQPAPVWLIKDILPSGFLSLLQGLPGTFKTFETVSINLCLATGRDWCGRRVKRCRTLYIAADDPDGPKLRAQAWAKHHGVPLDTIDAMMFDQVVNFTKDLEVAKAADDIKRQDLRPDFVTWDTLFHSTVGADLTKPEVVLPVVARMRAFLEYIGARDGGLLVHHLTKDGKSTWGSISLPASVDVILNSAKGKEANTAILTCERMRRAAAFEPIKLELKPIQVETLPDEEGVTLVDQLVVADGVAAKVEGQDEFDPDLSFMIVVLDLDCREHATRTEWLKAAQENIKRDNANRPSWQPEKPVMSEATFDRKLKVLKETGMVTGGGGKGELYTLVVPQGRKQGSSSPDSHHQGGG